QKVSCVLQSPGILELRGIGFVENLLCFIVELLLGRLPRQLGDLVSLQIGCTFVPSFLEKAPQEKVVLERLHVFLECIRAGVDVLVNLLVINQSSDGSLPLVVFG